MSDTDAQLHMVHMVCTVAHGSHGAHDAQCALHMVCTVAQLHSCTVAQLQCTWFTWYIANVIRKVTSAPLLGHFFPASHIMSPVQTAMSQQCLTLQCLNSRVFVIPFHGLHRPIYPIREEWPHRHHGQHIIMERWLEFEQHVIMATKTPDEKMPKGNRR